jgi:hypothetical protein
MPDYTTLAAPLPIKLEAALAKWLRSKRGALFVPELTIIGAHEPGVPDVPWLSILCRSANTHPQFAEVVGSGLPKVAQVEFTFRVHQSLDFHTTAALWCGQLQDLLASGAALPADRTPERASYRGLRTDLNPGGTLHPTSGLAIFAVSEVEDSVGMKDKARLAQVALEFVAQNGDPASE